MNVMKGKTMFVVSLLNADGGFMGNNIKDKLVEGGYSGVALKVCHGNHWNYAHGKADVERFQRLISGLVHFYGWHWNEGIDPAGEAAIASEAIDTYGLEAYMMDYEAPMKERPEAQVPLLQEFRLRKPDFPLGLCSYRYPSYHQEILWKKILPFFDFHAPQVYWMLANDPAAQMQRSYDELKALADLPFFPVGVACAEQGWEPTLDELDEFDEKVKAMGFEGIQWFTYRGMRDCGFFARLASHVWPVYTPDSGPDPVDCSELEAEVARLEAEVAALQALVGGNYDVAYNDGWNAGLQSLIAPLLK